MGPKKKSTKIREAARAIFLPFFSPSLTEWRLENEKEFGEAQSKASDFGGKDE